MNTTYDNTAVFANSTWRCSKPSIRVPLGRWTNCSVSGKTVAGGYPRLIVKSRVFLLQPSNLAFATPLGRGLSEASWIECRWHTIPVGFRPTSERFRVNTCLLLIANRRNAIVPFAERRTCWLSGWCTAGTLIPRQSLSSGLMRKLFQLLP